LEEIEKVEVKGYTARDEFSLPDLHFYQWCGRKYGINRGVYNTLDSLLYEKGYINVYKRRFAITSFLDYSLKEDLYDENVKVMKFGRGNLTIKLNEFVNG